MNIISELALTPGVIVAGEYSYRGDRFTYEGHLDQDMARMASIMCRATTMGVHMQTEIMASFAEHCGCSPARGWVVKGAKYSVCVVANVFCFIDNASAALTEVVRLMSQNIDIARDSLV
jgi:roadblock/LC7 domain-containing protein